MEKERRKERERREFDEKKGKWRYARTSLMTWMTLTWMLTWMLT